MMSEQHLQFYNWLTDSFGEEEGKKVFAAAINAQRALKAIEMHGDFIGARQSLIQIAMDLKGSEVWPAFPPTDKE